MHNVVKNEWSSKNLMKFSVVLVLYEVISYVVTINTFSDSGFRVDDLLRHLLLALFSSLEMVPSKISLRVLRSFSGLTDLIFLVKHRFITGFWSRGTHFLCKVVLVI